MITSASHPLNIHSLCLTLSKYSSHNLQNSISFLLLLLSPCISTECLPPKDNFSLCSGEIILFSLYFFEAILNFFLVSSYILGLGNPSNFAFI